MSYDYGKLKGRIVEIFGTQKKFAESIGFSERTLSLKLNNKVAWKQTRFPRHKNFLKLKIKKLTIIFLIEKFNLFEYPKGGVMIG